MKNKCKVLDPPKRIQGTYSSKQRRRFENQSQYNQEPLDKIQFSFKINIYKNMIRHCIIG